MELFVVGFLGLLLLPLILGWLLIMVSLFATPLVGASYLLSATFRKLNPLNKNPSHIDVLVVDDQYITVIPLIKLLEQAQVPFKYVTDGFEAIKELKNKHYRLIFMDYYMPLITGLETLIRADQLLRDDKPAMPVVFYTGAEISEKGKFRFKHVSIVDSWHKSMNRLELNSRLNRILLNNI